MSRSLRALIGASLLSLLVLAAPASATVPANADWHEYYIKDALPYPAGQPTLHADLLVPKGTDLTKDKLPIIVSVGPYFGHGGSSTPGDTATDDGPQLRWNDMITDGKLFQRGYGLLQVDLRGFGGSQGCNDFGGKGEQNDVFRAVEWAAKQPWALNNKVAIFGKSYDGWTGVMALNTKPKGLGAAIIQSPIIDGYRTLYMDGVHYGGVPGWWATPGIYQALDAGPPSTADVTKGRTDYIAGFATGTNPACYATNIALQDGVHDRNDAAGFWQERELKQARGSDVPTFWTHGFLDVNTKPDNFESVWSTLKGDKHAWFGQFVHTRPNEPGVGRAKYFYDELFAFLNEHIANGPKADLPAVEVENSDGKWRKEASWPPIDGVQRKINVRPGSYTDAYSASSFWSITEPLANDAWIAGTPRASLNLSATLPQATVIVELWDIAADGSAAKISKGAGRYSDGSGKKNIELYPADYVIKAGHRLGVQITNSDSQWLDYFTGQSVTVTGGSVTAPFLTYLRTGQTLPGTKSSDSATREKTTVAAATITASPTTWETAPALRPREDGQ